MKHFQVRNEVAGILNLCAVIFSISFMLSCQTIQTDHFSKIETRMLKSETVYRPNNNRTAHFYLDTSSSPSKIRLEYISHYDKYQVNQIGIYQIDYDRPYLGKTRGGDPNYTGPAQKMGERLANTRSDNKYIESNTSEKETTETIKAGETAVIQIPDISSDKGIEYKIMENGFLILDDTIISSILSKITNTNSLHNIRVSVPQKGLVPFIDTLDISGDPYIAQTIQTTQSLIAATDKLQLVQSDSMDTYQKMDSALINLASNLKYRFQYKVLLETIEKNNQMMKDKLNKEKYSIDISLPDFLIEGQIKSYDQNQITLWGQAIPRELTTKTIKSPGYLRNDSNIVVLYPDKLENQHLYIGNDNYFVRVDVGKNAFGGDVDVFIYTTKPPKEFESVVNKSKEIPNQIIAIDQQYAKDKRLWLGE